MEGGPLLIPNSSPSPAQGSATNLSLQGGFLLVRSLSWTSSSYKTGLCGDYEHRLLGWIYQGSLTSFAKL